jgi:hypothetical protein
MWMLSFVPDAILQMVIFAVMAAGGVLYLLSYALALFPPLALYKELVKTLATVLIIAGVYFYGSYDTEMTWRKRVEEVQAKVAQAEEEGKALTQKIDQVSKQKQKVRVEYYAQVKERIVEKAVQIDAKCELDPVVPKLHNDAATNPGKLGKVTIEDVKK